MSRRAHEPEPHEPDSAPVGSFLVCGGIAPSVGKVLTTRAAVERHAKKCTACRALVGLARAPLRGANELLAVARAVRARKIEERRAQLAQTPGTVTKSSNSPETVTIGNDS